MTKEEIGQIIKETRTKAGLTQLQVATQLNRPQQTIANWEVGRSQPDANTLFELFQVLGSDLNEAFGFKTKKPATPEGDGLTANERALLDLFRTLTPERQEKLATMVRAFVEALE